MEEKKTTRAEAKAARGFSRKIQGYLRYHGAAGAEDGASLYQLAARLLIQKDGKENASGASWKNFCFDNYDWIVARQAHPAPKKKAMRGLAKDIANADKSKAAKKAKPKGGNSSYIASDAFLSSYEWRKVRMQALKLHGAKCMCCGDTPANGAIMNVDHIKPRRLFPSLALEITNLQILCGPCNHGKGNWDQTDWRKSLT